MSTDLRLVLHSQDREFPPGRLADAKRGDTSDPGYPQPPLASLCQGKKNSDQYNIACFHNDYLIITKVRNYCLWLNRVDAVLRQVN